MVDKDGEQVRYVRVRPAHMGGPVSVLHPESGVHAPPNPAQPYRMDDPLVREYPWLFVADDEVTDDTPPTEVQIGARPIERATRAPGERRPGPGRGR